MKTRITLALGALVLGAFVSAANAEPAVSGNSEQQAEACFEKGAAFENANGESDLQQALQAYLTAAKLGHVESMNRLGMLYAEGRGVPQDYKTAFTWYQAAAVHGSAPALRNIATMYFYGLGVPQDYGQAAKVLQAAIRDGNPDAQNKLATLYDAGLGVPQDHARAFDLFQQAASQGYPPAMANLGRMYINGVAVERNDVRGYALVKAAVDAGVPSSMDITVRQALQEASGRLSASELSRAERLTKKLTATFHLTSVSLDQDQDIRLAAAPRN